MKKFFMATVFSGAVLVLSGCGSQQSVSQETALKEAPAEVKNEGGVINSIKDAIGAGSKMKCTSTSKDGEVSVVYVQGKKFKSTTVVEKKNQNSVYDGETMYFWTEGEKEGLKMATACLENLKTDLPETQQNLVETSVPNIEEEIANDENSSSCVPAGDIDFRIPAEVVFADQCEIMKKTLESMKNVKLPTGTQLPANIPGISN